MHSTIRVTRDRWRNWSGELQTTPRRLYCDDAGGRWKSPRTLADLQAIVRDARAEQVSVRVFGSSHSWAALVPNDGGYLVDNRMINSSDGYYNVSITPAQGDRKARATVPPGLLSSEFEAWLWKHGYTMPASAFEDCFTVGGMAATATHGVGIDIGTVSDMVVGMTFVDGRGEVRRWDRESCSEDELAAIQCGLGCLGLIHDISFEIEPRYETFHEALLINYADYFADTDQARANLRALHESHTSVEFFWWPFRFKRGLPLLSQIEINPEVFVLATCKQIPSDARPRGLLRRVLHLEVADMASMIGAGTAMRALSRFPQLAFLNAWAASFTNVWVAGRRGAYRMPQYDANHFVNATAVEFMTAMASEWSVPFRRDAPLDAADGYERVRQSFALLHDLVVEAFETHPIRDPRATPVAIAIEMRTLAASSALLSPGYQPEALRGQIHYAAPELVTTAGHPAWEEFARRANLVMTTSTEQLGTQVRCHQAKPCHDWPHPDHPEGMRAYLREQYRAAGTWDRFLKVREALDPDGVFLNDYLRAWFELPCAAAQDDPEMAEWAAE